MDPATFVAVGSFAVALVALLYSVRTNRYVRANLDLSHRRERYPAFVEAMSAYAANAMLAGRDVPVLPISKQLAEHELGLLRAVGTPRAAKLGTAWWEAAQEIEKTRAEHRLFATEQTSAALDRANQNEDVANDAFEHALDEDLHGIGARARLSDAVMALRGRIKE